MRLPAEQRRTQLLEVAIEIFAERGFHATSMDDIAEAAGVTKPVLYQHFPSKRALYRELLDDVDRQLTERLVDRDRRRGHRARAGPGGLRRLLPLRRRAPRRVPAAVRRVGAQRPRVRRGGRGDHRPRRRADRRSSSTSTPRPTTGARSPTRWSAWPRPRAGASSTTRARTTPTGSRAGSRRWRGSACAGCAPTSSPGTERAPMPTLGPLIPADESFHHQITDTFATVAQSDRSWTEKVCAMACARDGSLQLAFGMGKYPNRNVMDAYAGVSRGVEQWTVRASRELGHDAGRHRGRPDHLRGARAAEGRPVRARPRTTSCRSASSGSSRPPCRRRWSSASTTGRATASASTPTSSATTTPAPRRAGPRSTACAPS